MKISREPGRQRIRFERLESRRMLAAALPGDYNLNGTVDAGDCAAWRHTLDQIVTTPGDGADGNADGRIDQADYSVWAANFGRTLDDDPPPPPPVPNWFDATIVDEALRSLGSSLYQDALIDRTDMLSLLASVEDGDAVDATEFSDLQAIVAQTSLFGTLDYVWKLTSYVVTGSTANANYQGGALGNLVADATSTHLANLVNKWFLGLDRPATPHSYSEVSGQLFVDGPSHADVKQGALGNCSILAALAELAFRDPTTITSMFLVNGDGTYTVRFYNAGVAEYVTVDSYLPGGGNVYAGTPNSELWVALAEKACAQLNELTWCRFGYSIPTANSYPSIDSSYIDAALAHLTGQAIKSFNPMLQSSFASAFESGKSICFASMTSPPSGRVVPNHAYAVVGYDPATETVTLFNPWGIGYGLLTMTWSEIEANFQYFDHTA